MKYNTIYKRDTKWIFTHPIFTEEDDKETKTVCRMNDIFSKIGIFISDYTSSDKFPDGGRFFAECSFDSESGHIKCCFHLKQRGRTLSKKTILYTIQKGYIIRSEII